MKGIVVKTDMTIEVRDFAEPLYKTVGEAVGGYIEIVHPMGLQNAVMVVNDEGLMHSLPLNVIGSCLYGTHIHHSPIVGNVVIMKEGYVNGERDLIGLEDSEIEPLLEQLNQLKGYFEKRR